MDRFLNPNSGTARATSASFASGAAAAMAPDKHADPLQFPGDDGGRSLSAWARRDLEATLQLLADRAQYITGGSGAAIALRDGEHIICRASSGPSAPEVGSYLQVSSGLSGESVRTRKILSCDNALKDPRVNRESCRALGIASFVVMPLVREDGVVGIFEIFSAQPHAFQERDIQALERMGEMVNTALDQVMKPQPKAVKASGDTQKIPIVTKGMAAELVVAKPASVAEPIELALPVATASAVRVSEPLPTKQEVGGNDTVEPAISPDPLPKVVAAVGTCASCGFPVSSGRAFCLDCEAALPEKFGSPATPQIPAAPAFLTDLGEGGSQPSGVKQWLIAHRYLLGTILVLGGTAALLLFR